MKQFILIFSLAGLTLMADARIWTDANGRKVDAHVVRVNPNRTVVLKNSQGKVVTVPFNTFVEEDVLELESILALPFTPHLVTWREMNTLFSVEIWKDPLLWDDPTAKTAERMQLKKESKTTGIIHSGKKTYSTSPSLPLFFMEEKTMSTACRLFSSTRGT